MSEQPPMILQYDQQKTQYLATNLYTEYENTFNDAHYFKVNGRV